MARNSNVGTQYIICECGDNFPNEDLLNLHLANDHADVDTDILREPSPEPPKPETKTAFLIKHEKTEDQPQTTLKTYSRNQQKQQSKPETPQPKKPQPKLEKPQPKLEKPDPKPEVKKKKPPVIKLQNLKRIDSISLLQNLRNFTGFIKLEPAVELHETVTKVEPVYEAAKCEPEPECEMELSEPNSQVFVKSELTDSNEEIYYQCDVCNTIFYTEADFDVHYQSTHAMKVEPSAEQILEEHLVTDHIDDAGVQAGAAADAAYYYECEMCHKIFASEEYFNIHYNKVHGGLMALTEETEETEEGVMVQEREECLTEEQAAENYTIEEYKGPAPPKAPEQVIYYKCDLCKILYPSEKAYNTHFEKKHSSPGAGAGRRSPPAGFRFIEQDLGAEYPAASRPHGVDVFCCEFCPKTFNMKRSLQVHRKRVHGDKLPGGAGRNLNRSKVCDVCGRAYNSNAALRYHQRRHTGEKPYPCTMCPKRFTMPMFLQIHLRTHTGEKPYECMQCPKAFTNKAALIRHDRVHTGVKPYPCPECGKYFTQSNSMKLHVSTVHLKLPAPYKSKNRRTKSEARALQLALKGLPRGASAEDFQH